MSIAPKISASEWKQTRHYYPYFAIFTALLTIILALLPKDIRDKHPADLVALHGLIVEKAPEFHTGRGGYVIKMHMKGYRRTFNVSAHQLNSSNWVLLKKEVHAGDTLSALISRSDFANVQKPSMLFEWVQVEQLNKNNLELVSLEEANKEKRAEMANGIPLGIAITIVFLLFWVWRNYFR